MDRSSLNAKAALVLNDRALEHEKALAQLQCLDQEAFNQPDSSDFFQSLDQLRRMQIDLALEHLSLETVSSDTQISSDGANDEDETSARYRRNAERFVKKEKDVNNLMERLEALSEAMRKFHDATVDQRSRARSIHNSQENRAPISPSNIGPRYPQTGRES